MSLTLYSAKSKVATKLKANGFEIGVGEDEKINIIQEDKPNVYPKFNCLYNKSEVDARVVNGYIENGGSLEGFGDIPITEKSTQILEYRASIKKSILEESNRELIKEEFCVNTFNDIIEGESKTCEAQCLQESQFVIAVKMVKKNVTTFFLYFFKILEESLVTFF